MGAVSILAVCAMLAAGMALIAPQSEAFDSNDYLITTSDLTFDPNLGSLTGSSMSSSQRFASDQKYSGTTRSSVTWSGMAQGVTVSLPVYLPGTTQAIADVSSGGKYVGSYYLSGWATTPTGTTGFTAAGDEYKITSNDTRLYAVWTKAADGTNTYHDTYAPSSGAVNSTYSYAPITKSSVKDSENYVWYFCLETISGHGYKVASVPSWMSYNVVTDTRITVSFGPTSPTEPGNYYVEFIFYDAGYSGSNDNRVWWVISVPPEGLSEYTYSYDTATSSGPTPSGGKALYGQTFELNDGFVNGTEIVNPDDSSKTLAGWYLHGSSGTDAYFKLGQLVSMAEITSFASNGKLTFKADWQALDGVVVLSMDGASLKNVDAYVAKLGGVITLPVAYDTAKASQLQKENCTLIGWNTLTQGDSTNGYGLWAPGSMLTMDTGVLKAEAFWWETSKLSSLKTVTFYPGDGSYGITTQKVPSGYFAYLPQCGVTAPGGMKFLGWSYVENGTESDLIRSDSIPVTSDINLYAVYGTDAVNPTSYRVFFNTNGGKGAAVTQVVKQGGYAHQPTGISKEGCILECWRDSNGDPWDFSKNTVKADTTLTASWATHWTYTVSGLTVNITLSSAYDRSPTVNWGDGKVNSDLTHTYEAVNASCEISVTSYASSTASDTEYWSMRTLTGLEGEFVPQAVTVTVTFDAYPGRFPDRAEYRVVEIEKGKQVSEPTDIPEYDDEHAFAYWKYSDAEFKFDSPIYGDIVLYVQWTDVFITSFNPCYDGAAAIPSISTPSGESLALPSPGVYDGYVFNGWHTMRSGAGTHVGGVGESYTPQASRTLYAYWKVAESDTEVTVKFDVGQGSAVEDVTVRLGESFKLPASTWSGHELIFWYKVSEKIGAPGVEYTPDESCTLKAVWLDSSSGETVDQDDFLIPEACISIETMADGSGWTLHGSGRNAAEFHWYISSDGKRSWNDYGTGKDILIPSTDYTEDGTYWVQLTATSKTGQTATSYGSFTVGDADGGKKSGILAYLGDHPAVAVGLVIAILALVFVARWYL